MTDDQFGVGIDAYRLIAEQATDYAIFTMDHDTIVRTWSPGAERIVGYTEAEIRGQSADPLFVPEDRQAGIPELERSLALRVGRAENERWHLKKDGSRFWGAGVMVPLRSPQGEHLGYGKLIRDFTRRRKLEAAHLEAQRRESAGVLAAGLAHLFNNQLTAALGNLELLTRLPELRSHAHAQELARDAIRAGTRMADLTQQILTFTGKTRSLRLPLDLCDEVAAVVRTLEQELPGNVRVAVAVATDCPPVEGDRALIRQLLDVLLQNSVEALAERGGLITVKAEVRYLAPALVAQPQYGGFDLHPGPYVSLAVADDGPGLTPDAQARVFEPFYSTKFLGRGLGLSSAMGITRLHGGAITLRSTPGSGTAVEVLLPAAAPAAGAHDQTRLALVVDDEELVRGLTMRILEAEGFTVIGVENGDQALRTAERLSGRVDLVLLDAIMPVLDGRAALPGLRARLGPVPIVMMTGEPVHEAGNGADALDVSAWIAKPFTFDQLLGAVRQALGTRSGGPRPTPA